MAEKEMEKNQTEERRGFCCQYCDRVFTNKQALGGHQNSHRKERAAAVKKAKASVPFFPALSGMNFSKSLLARANSQAKDASCPPQESYELTYTLFLPAPSAESEGETPSSQAEAGAATTTVTDEEEDTEDGDIDLTLRL